MQNATTHPSSQGTINCSCKISQGASIGFEIPFRLPTANLETGSESRLPAKHVNLATLAKSVELASSSLCSDSTLCSESDSDFSGTKEIRAHERLDPLTRSDADLFDSQAICRRIRLESRGGLSIDQMFSLQRCTEILGI